MGYELSWISLDEIFGGYNERPVNEKEITPEEFGNAFSTYMCDKIDTKQAWKGPESFGDYTLFFFKFRKSVGIRRHDGETTFISWGCDHEWRGGTDDEYLEHGGRVMHNHVQVCKHCGVVWQYDSSD